MKRRLFLTTLIALLAPCVSFADDVKDMEGTWKVSEAEANGEKIDSEDLKSLTVKIAGDRYEVIMTDRTETGSMKLDPALKPKTMDATPADGPNSGNLIKAIYEIDGDKMRVCYAFGGDGARPSEFSTSGGGTIMITYKREKAEKKEKPEKSEKAEKAEKTEKTDKSDKAEKNSDKGEKK